MNDETIRQCPLCSSTNIVELRACEVDHVPISGCGDCLAVWESLPTGEDYRTDGELMAFREPCDNCAFRPGSPESEDKAKWRELLAKLKAGGRFFCHKAVPFHTEKMWTVKDEADTVKSFDYPKREDGKEDPEQMRLCRGYLNVWSKWIEQEFGTYENPKEPAHD